MAVVKVRETYPSGQTSASKIKALLFCLDAKKGKEAADAWLATLRLARADLDDETRLLPLMALHTALEQFVRELPNGLDEVARYFVVPDNLGVWARLLRGTQAPEQAFSRLDASESEYGRTTRWETLVAREGRWRGRVRIGHDPGLEKDGLLARARVVELAVVPMLFGYPQAVVTTLRMDDEVQEFEARWELPRAGRTAAIGAACGGAVGAGAVAVHAAVSTGAVAAALCLASATFGLLWARDRAQRVESVGQAMRVHALERSLALRDTAQRGSAGDLEGSVVAGQYRIGARMGSGASGVIYQATRITDGLPVAIKLLRAATAHDAVASDRLRREAEALGLAWHPNVVEVIDHGHLADGTSYLVMELLRGESLSTRLRGRGRLTAPELYPIALQLAEAIVAIHAAGVVHRDLKPANIFIVRDDAGREKAKILDFGIARVEWEEMRITNMGAPLGTPGYMSPEQERGAEVDARSDIYAIGAVLYECLVGEPPPAEVADMWTPGTSTAGAPITAPGEPPLTSTLRPRGGRSVDDIDAPRVRDADSGVQPASRRLPSAPPTALLGELSVPGAWRTLVERALAKRLEDRFQDARSLLVAIRALRSEAPPTASEALS